MFSFMSSGIALLKAVEEEAEENTALLESMIEDEPLLNVIGLLNLLAQSIHVTTEYYHSDFLDSGFRNMLKKILK